MSAIVKDAEYAETVEAVAERLSIRFARRKWSDQRHEVKAIFREHAEDVLGLLAGLHARGQTERRAS